MLWRPRRELLWSEMLSYNTGICFIMFPFSLFSSLHSLKMTCLKSTLIEVFDSYELQHSQSELEHCVRFIGLFSMHFSNCLLIFEKMNSTKVYQCIQDVCTSCLHCNGWAVLCSVKVAGGRYLLSCLLFVEIHFSEWHYNVCHTLAECITCALGSMCIAACVHYTIES